MSMFPSRFKSVEQLEDVMSTPSAALVAALRGVPGDMLVLGVGGKMGPTLARMAKRAAPGKASRRCASPCPSTDDPT